jgi:hypothetical protein
LACAAASISWTLPISPVAPAAGEGDLNGAVHDGGPAPVPLAQRRHRPGDVLGEQGDQGVGVAAFHGGGEGGDGLADPGVAELAQGLLLRARRDPLGEQSTGAGQGGVHRGGGGVHHGGDLGGGEAEHVEQEQRGPLVA